MGMQEKLQELRNGFETAYIDKTSTSNLAYKPQFISNDYKQGKKVLASIEDELMACDQFQISVAFITMGGITPLLQILQELEEKGIKGEILTTNYLSFSEPEALKKLNALSNITLKMYDVDKSGEGFHTKGYIFRKAEIYRIIIGSSNITKTALTTNREWNTRIVSTSQGEMAKSVVDEFYELWNSKYALDFDEFYENYKKRYELIKKQRKLARSEEITSIEKYRLQPNSMQVGFITNLQKIVEAGEKKALLISATGTGKTYASAFAMRELGYKRVLFLVHRGQIAKQALESYKKVFNKSVSMGMVTGKHQDYEASYIFATIQTLSKEEVLEKYDRNAFDAIVIDEAHHSSANSYKKVMEYFTPKLWLGMTATPDKRDDNLEGRNIYEIFNHQIAYEIRLQDAMEEDLLCTFHYFGITDLKTISDAGKSSAEKMENFRYLTSDERVEHVMKQAEYFGHSGERVKGLIFCSRIDEANVLSHKFKEKGWRTQVLSGSNSEEERASAIEKLAGDESEDALDYILSVDIFSEGVDVPEINQVIMLRPTESPIVFIQQLGRGLRKAVDKEYVVILDFIGNYRNNFMIPIALYGDRSYNSDTIRKYMISGNNIIPGSSTIHFDEISKERIFHSIDKIRGIRAIIRENYMMLKNRLGRIPYLLDFYENGEIDPLVIIREYKTYQDFLCIVEPQIYKGVLSEQEKVILEYLCKTVLSGVRPYELEILKDLFQKESITKETFEKKMKQEYLIENENAWDNAIYVLEGHFVSNKEEYEKFANIEIVKANADDMLERMYSYTQRLSHVEFRKQMKDIVSVGLKRYKNKYSDARNSKFVLYEKYSRRDVSFLMNCEKDLSSTMYGMKRIGEDVFIFVTYHKVGAENEDKLYADGKPDYADMFVDNMIFKWDSQIGKGPESGYMKDVVEAKRRHLFVKKSDAETSFYYMGTFDIINIIGDKKKDNNGNLRDITKVTMKMHYAVREDLLRYLQSKIITGENK